MSGQTGRTGRFIMAASLAVCAGVTAAAVPETPLTEAGEALAANYAGMPKSLRAEVAGALPVIAEADWNVLQKARAAVTAAEKTAAKADLAAQEALAREQTNALDAAKVILTKIDPFLKSDKLDAKLVKGALLVRATPHALAGFAQQGAGQEALVEKLLADTALMDQMLEAGGAKAGRYGEAMKIYTDILKASPRAHTGFGQRLALATSLEHAVPIVHESWSEEYTRLSGKPPSTTVVDPVQRFLHYEKACLEGELDPAFKELTVWEYRHVVDSDATDQMLAWGREMLRNYRPDHIATRDHGWRYSRIVKTDVAYASSTTYKDSDEWEYFQNVLKNGGICGRRALFARFILQCFGNPTWGVYQEAHAATGRWTPEGWRVNLGAKWQYSWFDGRSGSDFELETQARRVPGEYRKVLRALWIGDLLGEPRYDSMKPGSGGLWNRMAVLESQRIVAAAKLERLAAVGQDIGEANESKIKDAVEQVAVTESDRQIVTGPDGMLTIPAVACSTPTGSTEKIVFMKSGLGGMQLHWSRLGKPEPVEYMVDAPEAGQYTLRARVVTVSPDQHLWVAVNEAKEPVDIALPYTLGKWDQTPPVEVVLAKGRNVLRFTRNEPVRGVTMKEFTLRP